MNKRFKTLYVEIHEPENYPHQFLIRDLIQESPRLAKLGQMGSDYHADCFTVPLQEGGFIHMCELTTPVKRRIDLGPNVFVYVLGGQDIPKKELKDHAKVFLAWLKRKIKGFTMRAYTSKNSAIFELWGSSVKHYRDFFAEHIHRTLH